MTEAELKEQIYKQTIENGKNLQKAMNTPIDKWTIENMNEQAIEGLKKVAKVNRLIKIIDDINKKTITYTTAVRPNTKYEKWCYIEALVGLTDNVDLKEFVEQQKEKVRLKNE